MKDIPIEELAGISTEVHEAATRVGCTHVSITGQIWPGGQSSGPAAQAARFVEFSWLRAAVVNGQAVFDESDPGGYAALLIAYGLESDPSAEANQPSVQIAGTPAASVPVTPERIQLTARILPSTQRELERQAQSEGISIDALLDWKFQPRAT